MARGDNRVVTRETAITFLEHLEELAERLEEFRDELDELSEEFMDLVTDDEF